MVGQCGFEVCAARRKGLTETPKTKIQTPNKSQTPNPKAESSGQPRETPCSSSPSRVHHRSGGGADLLLQRLTYKLEQSLRRRIVRQAEILVQLAVVGFL